MEYQTTDFPTDPFQTSAPVQSTTVTGPKEFYQVVEAKDMFESVGFPSPWDEIPENKKQEYRDRHINALMAMAIYFIVVIWAAAGAIFMWYIWLHGQPAIAVAVAILFIIAYGMLVYFVLEKRYQDVYLAHPFMVRP